MSKTRNVRYRQAHRYYRYLKRLEPGADWATARITPPWGLVGQWARVHRARQLRRQHRLGTKR